jgi:hypothetical protein
MTTMLLLAGSLVAANSSCVYNEQVHITFLGHNVIECLDSEGGDHCRARCSADFECTGYGLYTSSSKKGRCCTKASNVNPTNWSLGTSFTKENTNCTQNQWPAKVEHSTMFAGNSSFIYNKGAMIESLPGSRVVGAMQAGEKEASNDQRILVGLSKDAGRTWGDFHAVDPQPSSKLAQWEPTLYYDDESSTLWLIYSEGPVLLYAKTSTDAGNTWTARRIILNATDFNRTQVWPVNRVVVMTVGTITRWILPCDWGCSADSAAFALISVDKGRSWTPGADIVVDPGKRLCPEPAMIAVNATTGMKGTDATTSTTLLAIIRSSSVGFQQTVSHDGGDTWELPTNTGVPGASSKPALALVPTTSADGGNEEAGGGEGGRGTEQGGNPGILLSYNLRTRVQMVMSVSWNGGGSWEDFAMLDTGEGLSQDCYPTTIVMQNETVTVYSAYHGGPGGSQQQGSSRVASPASILPAHEEDSSISTRISGITAGEIRIARTSLPRVPSSLMVPQHGLQPLVPQHGSYGLSADTSSITHTASTRAGARGGAGASFPSSQSASFPSQSATSPLPTRQALLALGHRLQGHIVLPGQPEYPDATTIQNALIRKTPLGVVYAESSQDVAETVSS